MISPLNAEDEQTLYTILERGKSVAQLIANAKDAGVPVQEQEDRNTLQMNLAQSLLDKFFPTRMTPTSDPSDPSNHTPGNPIVATIPPTIPDVPIIASSGLPGMPPGGPDYESEVSPTARPQRASRAAQTPKKASRKR